MEPRKDTHPFAAPLEEHSEHGKKTWTGYLRQVGNNKDFVVRDLGGVSDASGKEDRAALIQKSARITGAHKELEEKYGIPVSVQLIIGENERREETIFAIAHNIHSADNPREEGIAAYALHEKILSYYESKISSGEEYLVDILGSGQYVFGKKAGDSKNKFYLTDVDGFLNTPDSDEAWEDLRGLAYTIKLIGANYKGVADFSPLVARAQKLVLKLAKSTGREDDIVNV